MWELVRYEGMPPKVKETVLRRGLDYEALYSERDRLNFNQNSLALVRHGVRPRQEEVANA